MGDSAAELRRSPADDEPTGVGGRPSLPRALASNALVWRGAVAGVGLLALLIARSGAPDLFDEILGLTMVAVAACEQIPRLFDASSVPAWRSVVTAALGALVFLWPSETGTSIGLIAAAVIASYGIAKAAQGLRTPAGIERLDRAARGVLMIALAIVVAVFPEATVRAVVIAIGGFWVFQGVAVASAIGRSGGEDPTAPSLASAQRSVSRWLELRPVTGEDRGRIDVALFGDGTDRRRRMFRLFSLMAIATTIATLGTATDSTAVVIGAMLIAPLMTPIMATATALLRGWPSEALRSGAVVIAAAAGSIALAWILAAFIPNLAVTIANDEVTSRTAPNVLDLGIAVAAGAAGAFAFSRSDVSDTLPGVAVAVALVPPLAVAGVTLNAGSFQQAVGALLLFGTNLVAMLAMAGVVFVITGYVAWPSPSGERRRVRASYATVATGVILLLIPLGLSARAVVREADSERSAHEAVADWLGADSPFRVSRLDLDGGTASITLQGPGEPPAAAALHDRLVDALGERVTLELRLVSERVELIDDVSP
jgi:uncharacterized hydrophobic protein (TIGR00271 family)